MQDKLSEHTALSVQTNQFALEGIGRVDWIYCDTAEANCFCIDK